MFGPFSGGGGGGGGGGGPFSMMPAAITPTSLGPFGGQMTRGGGGGGGGRTRGGRGRARGGIVQPAAMGSYAGGGAGGFQTNIAGPFAMPNVAGAFPTTTGYGMNVPPFANVPQQQPFAAAAPPFAPPFQTSLPPNVAPFATNTPIASPFGTTFGGTMMMQPQPQPTGRGRGARRGAAAITSMSSTVAQPQLPPPLFPRPFAIPQQQQPIMPSPAGRGFPPQPVPFLFPNHPSARPPRPPRPAAAPTQSASTKSLTTELFVRTQGPATAEEVFSHFSQFGSPVRIEVIKPPSLWHIEMDSPKTARAAVISGRNERFVEVKFYKGKTSATTSSSNVASTGMMDVEDGDHAMIAVEQQGDEEVEEPLDASSSGSASSEQGEGEGEEEEEEANEEEEEEEEEDNEDEEEEPQPPQQRPRITTTAPTRQRTTTLRTGAISQPPPTKTMIPPDEPPTAALSLDDHHIVGTCEQMCAMDEIVKRSNDDSLSVLEQTHPEMPELGTDLSKLVIKEYQRPAAGKEKDKPHQIRTEKALDMTAAHLWSNIIDIDAHGPDPRFRDHVALNNPTPQLSFIYSFVDNRLRAIRSDFTVQGMTDANGQWSAAMCRVLEENVRFYIMMGFELCTASAAGTGFNAKLNLDSLKHSIDFLRGGYERGRSLGHEFSNEAEMRGYDILLQANEGLSENGYIMRRKLLDPSHISGSDEVMRAERIRAAFLNNDYFTFFSLFRDPQTPYLVTCLMHMTMLFQARMNALQVMNGCFNPRNKEARNMFELERLRHVLCFDTSQDTIEFVHDMGLETDGGSGRYVTSFGKHKPLQRPEVEVKHFSDLVFQKRGGMRRGEIIADRGRTNEVDSGQRQPIIRPPVIQEAAQVRKNDDVEEKEEEAKRRQRELEEAHKIAQEEQRVRQVQQQQEEEENARRRINEERAAAAAAETRERQRVAAAEAAETHRRRVLLEAEKEEAHRIAVQREVDAKKEAIFREQMRVRRTGLLRGLVKSLIKRKMIMYFKQWEQMAHHEQMREKKRDALHRMLVLRDTIAKSIVMRKWRIMARLATEREEKFNSSLLDNLEDAAFKSKPPTSPISLPLTHVSLPVIDTIELGEAIRHVLPVDTVMWKITLIWDVNPNAQSLTDWLVKAITSASAQCSVIVLSCVSTLALHQWTNEAVHAMRGADAFIVIMSPHGDDDDIIRMIANPYVSGSTNEAPVPILSLLPIHSTTHHRVLTHDLVQDVSWLASHCPERFAWDSVPLSTLVLSCFPALLDNDVVSSWLSQGKEVLEALASDLSLHPARDVAWPAIEAVQAYPDVFPPLTWNSGEQVDMCARVLLTAAKACEVGSQLELPEFASHFGASEVLQQLQMYALDDTKWIWRHLVRFVLLQCLAESSLLHVYLLVLDDVLPERNLAQDLMLPPALVFLPTDMVSNRKRPASTVSSTLSLMSEEGEDTNTELRKALRQIKHEDVSFMKQLEQWMAEGSIEEAKTRSMAALQHYRWMEE